MKEIRILEGGEEVNKKNESSRVLTSYFIYVKCQPKDTDISRPNSWPPVSRL